MNPTASTGDAFNPWKSKTVMALPAELQYEILSSVRRCGECNAHLSAHTWEGRRCPCCGRPLAAGPAPSARRRWRRLREAIGVLRRIDP